MQQDKHIQEARKLLVRWTQSPLLWVQDNFPAVTLSAQQKDFWDAFGALIRAKQKAGNGDALTPEEEELSKKLGISISAGQGTGKDFTVALAIYYFLWVNPHCAKHPKYNDKDRPRVVATGVGGKHLRNVLWSELSKVAMLSKSTDPKEDKPIIKELFDWQTEKLSYKDKNFENWFAEAVTINANSTEEEQAKTLYGRHAHSMLIVADEAAGIPDPVFVTMEGTMTDPMNIALMIFNPIRTKGYAVRSQNEESGKWIVMRWDAEESELVSRDSIERKRAYGEDSYEWRVLVKGLPPLVDVNCLVPPDWVISAIGKDLGPVDGNAVIIGADVGGGGDRSVVATRQGGVVQPFECNSSVDTSETEDWVYAQYLRKGGTCAVIDNIGIGAGVYDHLKKKITARKGDAREKAKQEVKFFNRRAEAYWKLREAFESGNISIPQDQDLINELGAITYDPSNKNKICDKKEIRKKLGGKSPDKADALALTYYVDETLFKGNRNKTKGIDYSKLYLR